MNEQQLRENRSLLETSLTQQRTQFAQWTQDNTKQAGTKEYNAYVQQFEDWQKSVIDRIAEIDRHMNPKAAGPAGPESILDDLLTEAQPMQFLMAFMNLSMRDPTFLPAMLNSYKNLPGKRTHGHGVSTVSNPPPSLHSVHQPHMVYQTVHSTVPTQFTVPPPTHTVVPTNFNVPPPTVGVVAASAVVTNYSYPPPSVPVSAPFTTVPPPQQVTQPQSKERYRVPSPVRDYNAVQAPFLDFSMK